VSESKPLELRLVPEQQAGSAPGRPEREPRGVTNPRVIDLISLDTESDEVVLSILETRPWGSDPSQLAQLEDKLNSYLAYVLEGWLARQYPQYEGRKVRFQLDCAAAPGATEERFLRAAMNFAAGEGIGFTVRIVISGA
jgi:hypothetical protein